MKGENIEKKNEKFQDLNKDKKPDYQNIQEEIGEAIKKRKIKIKKKILKEKEYEQEREIKHN